MSLKKRMEIAFLDKEKPAPGCIAGSDNGHTTLEARQVDAFFAGKSWDQIDVAELANYRGDEKACLIFMNCAARSYYLPAFMTICLLDPLDETELLRPTIACFDRRDDNITCFDFMVTAYNGVQKQLIREFLFTIRARIDELGISCDVKGRSFEEIYNTAKTIIL